jgi:hypothetical protein
VRETFGSPGWDPGIPSGSASDSLAGILPKLIQSPGNWVTCDCVLPETSKRAHPPCVRVGPTPPRMRCHVSIRLAQHHMSPRHPDGGTSSNNVLPASRSHSQPMFHRKMYREGRTFLPLKITTPLPHDQNPLVMRPTFHSWTQPITDIYFRSAPRGGVVSERMGSPSRSSHLVSLASPVRGEQHARALHQYHLHPRGNLHASLIRVKLPRQEQRWR